VVRIRDNFGGQIPQWRPGGVERVGDNFQVRLDAGQAIEASFVPAAVK
jgi:hypothetical protein